MPGKSDTSNIKIEFYNLSQKYNFQIYIFRHWFTNPPLFDIKLVYFNVIEVADSESDLGLFSTALV